MRRRRVYRVGGDVGLQALIWIAFGIGLSVYSVLEMSDLLGGRPSLGALSLALATPGLLVAIGIRLLLVGVYPRDAEVVIRNLFRTEKVPWKDVESFSVRAERDFGNMIFRRVPTGTLDRRDGSSIRIWAFMGNKWSGAARPLGLVAELNDLLAEQRGASS